MTGEGASAERCLLDDQLCFALYRATNAITRSYRPRLDRIGLTYPQYVVMLALWQDGPMRSGELAARLSLPAHGLTPVLRRLESAGLLRRRREPGDGRAARIELTERGAALEGPAAAVRSQVACETGLSDSELAAAREQLHRLADRLESASGSGRSQRSSAVGTSPARGEPKGRKPRT